MTPGAPSKIARAMAWLVLVLSVMLVGFGIYRYGLSAEVHHRFWSDIVDRLHGPMTFRFYLQPTMAFIAALVDGIKDARYGHKSFFWSVRDDEPQRAGRLREGLISTARVALLGISMDTIYQIKVLDRFYPAETVMMALLLAVIPYFIFRWVVELVARWWIARKATG